MSVPWTSFPFLRSIMELLTFSGIVPLLKLLEPNRDHRPSRAMRSTRRWSIPPQLEVSERFHQRRQNPTCAATVFVDRVCTDDILRNLVSSDHDQSVLVGWGFEQYRIVSAAAGGLAIMRATVLPSSLP